jgi:hypothetical protein
MWYLEWSPSPDSSVSVQLRDPDRRRSAYLQPVSAMVWQRLGIWSGLGAWASKYLYLPGPEWSVVPICSL